MKKTITILLLTAVVATGCVFGTQAPVEDNELVDQVEIDTSDWKTYRNEEYGFELKYPKEIGEIKEIFSYFGEVEQGVLYISYKKLDKDNVSQDETFIENDIAGYCMADGRRGSSYCKNIEAQKVFSGGSGSFFKIKLDYYYFSNDGDVEKLVASRDDIYGILFNTYQPPYLLYLTNINIDVIKEIAETVETF